MVNYFELIKGLHYIIGPAGELITAIGITLDQWPVRGISPELRYIAGLSVLFAVHRV